MVRSTKWLAVQDAIVQVAAEACVALEPPLAKEFVPRPEPAYRVASPGASEPARAKVYTPRPGLRRLIPLMV